MGAWFFSLESRPLLLILILTTMHFPIPDGFEFPPDAEVGGEFTAVGTFRDNQDGTLSLVAIDDAPIMEMEEEEDGGKRGMKVEVEIEKGGKGGEEKGYESEMDGMMRRAMEKGLLKRGGM